MPCDRVYTTSVNLESLKVDDVELLVAALEDLGYTVTRTAAGIVAAHPRHGSLLYDARTGKVRQEFQERLGQSAQDLNAIKVGYSRRVVAKVATRFGWSVKEVRSASENVVAAFDATKRGF